jgi:hypothetical protein
MAAGPTVRETVNEVLRSKGWWEAGGFHRCPKCVEDFSTDTLADQKSHER